MVSPGGFAVKIAAAARRRADPVPPQNTATASAGLTVDESHASSPASSNGEGAGEAALRPAPPFHFTPPKSSGAQAFAEMWGSLSQRDRERLEAEGADSMEKAMSRYLRKKEEAMRKEKRPGSPIRALPFPGRKNKNREKSDNFSRQHSGDFPISSMPSGSPISPHSAELPNEVSGSYSALSARLAPPLGTSGDISLHSHGWPEVPEGGCSPGGAPANEVAFRVLQEHVALIVCSYCSPDVFDSFLQAHLPEEYVQAIHQTMRGISKLLDDEGKRRFGDVILGRRSDGDGGEYAEEASSARPAPANGGAKGRNRAFSFSVRNSSSSSGEKGSEGGEGGGDAEECWAMRSGGLLHGSDTLLRDFVREHKQFAEYLSLTLVNPIVVSSLEFASTKWADLHPPEPGPVLEPCFSRILVTPEGVRIRGGSGVALHRNLQFRFPEAEWRDAFDARKRLEKALSDVLLGKSLGRDKRSRMRKAFEKVGGKGKKEEK
eukprot:Hpha_TRINITY_DN11348_c0_g2::TRINITY_DN11348_c0_g2_i1::g.63304::m.63304